MKYEYLLLNLIILIGPLFLSFDKKVYFRQYWKPVFLSITLSALVFLTWDYFVTGIHWHFNSDRTISIFNFPLPVGEILFFITVPYACLFVWEVLLSRVRDDSWRNLINFYFIFILFLFLSLYLFFIGKYYTALVALAIFMISLLDLILQSCIFKYKIFPLFFLLITLLTFIFNGYLTSRPVVLYNEHVQLNFRVGTIPIEDFFYGYSHIFLNIILYTYFKKRDT